MKLEFGPLTNIHTKESAPIIVETAFPLKAIDILISGSFMIAGIMYAICKAYTNGCKAYEQAEYDTMVKLDIIK